MGKNGDIRDAAVPSKRCKYRHNETPKMRHERRIDTAHSPACLSQLRGFCEQRGLKLRIVNKGEHFIIQAGREQVAQWWPRSAKLIIRNQWQAGIHCHDVRQLIHEVSVAIGSEAP